MPSEVLPAPNASARTPVRPKRLLAGAAIALAVNLTVFAIGSAAGASWDVGQPSPVTWVAVVAATVVAFGVAGTVTWLASKKWPGFARFAAWAGLAFGLLSMLGLINASGAATALSLGLMHIATSASWFLSLTTGTRTPAAKETSS